MGFCVGNSSDLIHCLLSAWSDGSSFVGEIKKDPPTQAQQKSDFDWTNLLLAANTLLALVGVVNGARGLKRDNSAYFLRREFIHQNFRRGGTLSKSHFSRFAWFTNIIFSPNKLLIIGGGLLGWCSLCLLIKRVVIDHQYDWMRASYHR